MRQVSMFSVFIYIFVTIMGFALGSYLNSWIWRIHEEKWQWGGRSKCIHCARPLVWFENIPLASFLWLKGQCRTCGKNIPLDYFLVELALGSGFVALTYYHLHASTLVPMQLFRDLFFFAVLVVVFVYDFKYSLILSGLVWSGAIVAFIINHFYLQLTTYNLLLGMGIGGGFFMLQYIISRGRWIGGGDVRLGVMIGALLTWPTILVAFFTSYVLGALVATPLIFLKKRGLKSQLPFGTFLSIGTLLAMLVGNQIVQWYWSLIR